MGHTIVVEEVIALQTESRKMLVGFKGAHESIATHFVGFDDLRGHIRPLDIADCCPEDVNGSLDEFVVSGTDVFRPVIRVNDFKSSFNSDAAEKIVAEFVKATTKAEAAEVVANSNRFLKSLAASVLL